MTMKLEMTLKNLLIWGTGILVVAATFVAQTSAGLCGWYFCEQPELPESLIQRDE